MLKEYRIVFFSTHTNVHICAKVGAGYHSRYTKFLNLYYRYVPICGGMWS